MSKLAELMKEVHETVDKETGGYLVPAEFADWFLYGGYDYRPQPLPGWEMELLRRFGEFVTARINWRWGLWIRQQGEILMLAYFPGFHKEHLQKRSLANNTTGGIL